MVGELGLHHGELDVESVLAVILVLHGKGCILLSILVVLGLVGVDGCIVGNLREVSIGSLLDLGLEHRVRGCLHIVCQVLVSQGIVVDVLIVHTCIDEVRTEAIEFLAQVGKLRLNLALVVLLLVKLVALGAVVYGIVDCRVEAQRVILLYLALLELAVHLVLCLSALLLGHFLHGEAHQMVVALGLLLGRKATEVLLQNLGSFCIVLNLGHLLEYILCEGC